MWLYFSCVSCGVPTIKTFFLLFSPPLFFTVRDTTDGADKFHSTAFSIPVQFFIEVRTNSDSSRCYSLSISVRRLYCRTFVPYKSLLGFLPSIIFSLKYSLQLQCFTWAEMCIEFAIDFLLLYL